MAFRCDSCGKGSVIGRKHRHKPGVAGGRWIQRAQTTIKIFRPNLHKAKIKMDGVGKTLLLCTSCLREIKEKFPVWTKEEAKKSDKVIATNV